MIRRNFIGLALAATVLALPFPVNATSSIRSFDREAFLAAQQEGKPILIDITAPWCPTCRAQKPIIQALAGKSDLQGLIVFEVDFDSQKDVVRAFEASSQSTLIMYRGEKETARSVGDTDPTRIEALVVTAFAG